MKKFVCKDCDFNGISNWALQTHYNTTKHKERNMINILEKDEYSWKYYRANNAVIKRQAKINYYKKRFNREVYFIRESSILNPSNL